MQAEQPVEHVVYEGSVAGISRATSGKHMRQTVPGRAAGSIPQTM